MFFGLRDIHRCRELKSCCNRCVLRDFNLRRNQSTVRERKDVLSRITIFHRTDLHRDGDLLVLSSEEDINASYKRTTNCFKQEGLCERVPPTNLSSVSTNRTNGSSISNSIANDTSVTNSEDVFLNSIQSTSCAVFCLSSRVNCTWQSAVSVRRSKTHHASTSCPTWVGVSSGVRNEERTLNDTQQVRDQTTIFNNCTSTRGSTNQDFTNCNVAV